MKKIFILLVITLSFISQAFACDVCGCSLGGGYYGILPQFNKNFIGLRWSQARFHAYMNHDSQYLDEEYSHDTYRKLELWGRYYINKHFQVYGFVPYAVNTMNGTEQTVKINGLGDITVLANYLLINTGESKTARFKHTLLTGAGVKLPTGTYDAEDNGLIINRNFQLGTGSTDFIISAMYSLRYQKVGLNSETGYKINTRNSQDYLFGNQFHASTQFFVWQNVKAFKFLPNVGLYYEQAAKHQDGQVIQPNTGGSALLATAGMETYFKSFSLGFTYNRPIEQSYNSDEISEITSKDRFSVAVTYSF